MRFIPIGIADSSRVNTFMSPSDYSDKHFDGIQLRKTPNDRMVLIMHSKKTAPMEWKVMYGFSSVFFRSFEEAVAFCTERDMELVKGEPGYDRT